MCAESSVAGLTISLYVHAYFFGIRIKGAIIGMGGFIIEQ